MYKRQAVNVAGQNDLVPFFAGGEHHALYRRGGAAHLSLIHIYSGAFALPTYVEEMLRDVEP